MARPMRIEYPDPVYHATAGGNARNDIFHLDTDRNTFLKILSGILRRYNWLCHDYCLMDNHYHLLIEIPDGNLSEAFVNSTLLLTKGATKLKRDQIIHRAHIQHGYTMKAIADHPGIHYTTVSKVIKARKITDISRPDPIYHSKSPLLVSLIKG